ncbi:Spore coat protein U (SCPU) domain-containing protein [Sphingomonas carotinifaciens]|uniref:Spore coat protein U (SCPU) domain-containing protein n=2 Tax=Sphingomonas carotinifaciens TaxID=1166323 RepID=A0A1G7MJ16_9SPHN|nr:Spore coat protein U (SCPU) domain-containing protein [Sphingomonas carotinifaciens]
MQIARYQQMIATIKVIKPVVNGLNINIPRSKRGLVMFTHSSITRRAAAASFAFVALLAAQPAMAGDSNGTIGISLDVSGACAVNGGTVTAGTLGELGTITFAPQPGIFGDIDATVVSTRTGGGAITILCSPGLTPAMAIGAGAHADSSVRRMAFGQNMVPYRLYSDANHSNEIMIGQPVALGTATTDAISLPIFARVNSGGKVLAAGAYTDTVQVTLTW